jgi:hypothetical protein
MTLKTGSFFLLPLATLALAACGGGRVVVASAPATPAAPTVVTPAPAPAATIVTTIPATPAPPATTAVAGNSPGPGYVYVEGYYDWRGGQYVWVPGTWSLPPRTSLTWVPGHWQPTAGGYTWVSGYWQ